MENIIVTSRLDVKTLFNISLLMFFKTRTILIGLLYFAIAQYFILIYPSVPDWTFEVEFVAIFVVLAGGFFPFIIYRACQKRAKVSAAILETSVFTINADTIDVKAETVSGVNNWKYIVKCVERRDYILLMLSARTFYYLPKAGFKSQDDIGRLRNLVKEKGIKMTYH